MGNMRVIMTVGTMNSRWRRAWVEIRATTTFAFPRSPLSRSTIKNIIKQVFVEQSALLRLTQWASSQKFEFIRRPRRLPRAQLVLFRFTVFGSIQRIIVVVHISRVLKCQSTGNRRNSECLQQSYPSFQVLRFLFYHLDEFFSSSFFVFHI